jgi:hypothetical protein
VQSSSSAASPRWAPFCWPDAADGCPSVEDAAPEPLASPVVGEAGVRSVMAVVLPCADGRVRRQELAHLLGDLGHDLGIAPPLDPLQVGKQ